MSSVDAPQARLARLTSGQIDVLRGVADLKSSKTIARDLGISPHTVDQRLKRAIAILGVSTRFEAARLLGSVRTDHDRPYEALVYPMSDLSAAQHPADEGASPVTNRVGDGAAFTLHQAQSGYIPYDDWPRERRSWTSVLLEAGRRNDLTIFARTLCIGGIGLAAMLSLATAVALAEGLSRLF